MGVKRAGVIAGVTKAVWVPLTKPRGSATPDLFVAPLRMWSLFVLTLNLRQWEKSRQESHYRHLCDETMNQRLLCCLLRRGLCPSWAPDTEVTGPGSIYWEGCIFYFTKDGKKPTEALTIRGYQTLVSRWNIRGRTKHGEGSVKSRSYDRNVSAGRGGIEERKK